MRIDTTRFGLLDMEEALFIHFPWGIPGFERIKRYVLLEQGQGSFQWLQAVDEPTVAFVVCPPENLGFTYRVPEDKGKAIALEKWEDLLVLIMVSFDRKETAVRPHLRGPLLFNVSARQAYQWTIDSRELEKYVKTKSLAPVQE